MSKRTPKPTKADTDIVQSARANGAIVRAIDPYGSSSELVMAAFMATFHPCKKTPAEKRGGPR